jgi:hypothetical protein
MELIFIIIGGALSTAIIFMIIDRVRGNLPEDEDDLNSPLELHDPLPNAEEHG